MELVEAKPDIHELFCHYNSLYFGDTLGACVVSWSSPRMTSSSGVCCYQKDGGCEIVLSEPLLNYRSANDLKNTLLHQMIHAFLFIKNKNRNNSDHGPSFQAMMNDINSSSAPDYQRPECGYNITIYHDFHEEVDSHQIHHWLCELCGDLIKKSINSEPSAYDCPESVNSDGSCGNSSCQWHRHKKICTGIYKRLGEPPGFRNKRRESKGPHGLVECKFRGSSQTTRSQKAELDKLENTRLKTITRCFLSARGEGTQKDVEFEELKAIELKTEMTALALDIPRRVRTAVSRKRRYDSIKETSSSEFKEIVVYSAWLGFYEYAETEEDIPPLINKRTERRKRQKLLQELKGRD